MGMNRKAILFTSMALMISALLTIMFGAYQITPVDERVGLDTLQIRSGNQHIITLIAYIKTTLSTSTYSALQGMIEYIWINNEDDFFFDDEEDIKASFKECILYATLNNSNDPCPFMENQTITNFLQRLINLTNKELSVETNITIIDIWIEQQNPFSVYTYMNLSFFVKSKKLFWNRTELLRVSTTIEGLKDPLYFKGGVYNSTFKESLTKIFNRTTFEKFVNESEYKTVQTVNVTESSGGDKGMSFFARLTDDWDGRNDPWIRIASIVSPQKLIDAGFNPDDTYNRSNIDYLYWNKYEFGVCQLFYVKDNTNQALVSGSQLLTDFVNLTVEDIDSC